MRESLIYLDNAATTYPKSERVYKAMDMASREYAFNSGRGGYEEADEVTSLIEETRELIKILFGADETYEVVFQPSATIALNQILKGINWQEGDIVYTSVYEHNSVARTLYEIAKNIKIEIKKIPLNDDLTIDLEEFEFQAEKDKPRCVVSTVVSNVTGYILPVEEIAQIAKMAGAITVLDASQAAGLIPMKVDRNYNRDRARGNQCEEISGEKHLDGKEVSTELSISRKRNVNADYIVWAGHKTLYGPFGVGGYVADKKALKDLSGTYIHGGTGSDSLNLEMPGNIEGFEPGSHNTISIIGLRESLLELAELSGEEYESNYRGQPGKIKDIRDSMFRSMKKYLLHEVELRDIILEKLKERQDIILYPEYKNQIGKEYAGIVSFAVEGYDSDDIGDILSEDYNIAVRTGYHCAPWIHEKLGSEDTGGTVRISVGRDTKAEDVEYLDKIN